MNEQIMAFIMLFVENCYDARTWKIKPQDAVTDSASNTWCRAPGTVEGVALTENIMEHIAHVVEKDPLEVRLKNIPRNSPIRAMLQDFSKSVGIKNLI